MSDDAICKQEVRDGTLRCVGDALEALWGKRPSALVPGSRHSSAGCAIANTFATLMPYPALVYTDCLLIANEDNADSLVAVWHTKVVLLDDESDDASDQALWETFGDLPVYQVTLPQCMQDFIKCFDAGLYPDLIDDSLDEAEEFAPSLGGGGDGGTGGIYAELGGSEASPVMVGGSEAGGGA
jgi:hypothetical protein